MFYFKLIILTSIFQLWSLILTLCLQYSTRISVWHMWVWVTHTPMNTHAHMVLTLHIRQNWLWELERSHRSFVVCLTGSHVNLKGPMGTWKVSREPCDMSYRVSWELGRSHGSLVICLTESHGNLKGLMGTWKVSREPCDMSYRVSWELEGLTLWYVLQGLMGTWRVSWELEGSHGNSHGNLKRSHESLVICLTGSHGNLKGLMGTWRVSWELEGSHGNLKSLTKALWYVLQGLMGTWRVSWELGREVRVTWGVSWELEGSFWSLMGTWKVSRKPCDMSQGPWELDRVSCRVWELFKFPWDLQVPMRPFKFCDLERSHETL